MIDTREWTIYTCPECEWATLHRSLAEEHAVSHCDPDSWPWVAVVVAEKSRVVNTVAKLQEIIDSLLADLR